MKRLFQSTWLATRLEIILGCIFIYASIHKIWDPPDFAHMVYNYKMTPNPFINLIAIYLPWIELVSGAALVLGLRGRKGGAAVVGAMLLVFIFAIGFNLARGNAIDCGCFEGSSGLKTRAELLLEMWWVMARDILMVLAVAQIFIAGRGSPAASREPPATSHQPSGFAPGKVNGLGLCDSHGHQDTPSLFRGLSPPRTRS